MALSHNGNLKHAKNLIKKCKDAGADFVKFQTHLADHRSSLDETFRSGFKFKEKKIVINIGKKESSIINSGKFYMITQRKLKLIFYHHPFLLKR